MEMKAFNAIFAYYQKICDGSVTVSRWITLLYERIVHAIESKELTLDLKKANAAIDWIEAHCFHTEGPKAPGPFLLELWQKAIISCIFGLLDPETGKRAFREIVLIVARKNGKSLLASSIAKYSFQVDGGFGARVFTIAPKLEQADIIYRNVWQMFLLDPEWKALKEQIEASKDQHNRKTMDDGMLAKHGISSIYISGTNSSVQKLAFNSKQSDGFNPSLTICDEIAAWEGDKGLKVYEVMKSGMGARDMGNSPGILFSCSTAGYVNDSIYDELMKRSTRFLLGDSKEKRLLPFLYVIDDIQKWDDINELAKSNPNLGVSVGVDYLLDEIAVAEGSLSKRAEFICKMANIKQNASTAWLDTQTVEKASGEELRLEDFRHNYCVIGIDLSQTVDLTSVCACIEKNGELYVFSHFFMPAERIQTATASDGVPYEIFRKQGLLTLSGENFVDYHDCYNWIVSLMKDYEILPLVIGYDRYSAQYLIDDLRTAGLNCDDVYQGFNLTPVIRQFEGEIKDGIIHIGNNNLLKAHLLNVALKMDNDTQKVKMVKVGSTARIDGAAALMDAMTVRQKHYALIGQQLKNVR